MLKKIELKYLIFICLALVALYYLKILKLYPLYNDVLFQDWLYIKNYANCNLKLFFSQNEILCTKLHEFNFVYPEIWIKLYHLFSNFFLEIYFLVFFAFIFFSIKIFNQTNLILHFLIFFSPPVILAISRGNNDLVIFSLISIFLFLNKKKSNFQIIPLLASIYLKIYSLIILLFILADNKLKNLKTFFFISLIILVIVFQKNEILQLNNNWNFIPVTLGFNSNSIFYITSKILNINFNNYQIISLISFLFIVCLIYKTKNKSNNLNNENLEDSFLIGSLIIIFNFFFVSGYSYKLIFIFFTIPYLNFLYKNSSNKNFFKYSLFLIFINLWFEFIILFFRFILDLDMNQFQNAFLEYKKNNQIENNFFILSFIIFFQIFLNWLTVTILIKVSLDILKKRKKILFFISN